MKIKAIERLCKARGNIVLCDEPVVDVEMPARQWMGDGVALYPLDGVPRLDEGGVMAIFDIDAKKREKIRLEHRDRLPETVCFADAQIGEVLLEQYDVKISVNGAELVLLRGAEDKLVCIQKQYLTPFEKLKELELYGRVSANGTVYVAVKVGCILRGVILTYQPTNEKFVETMGAIYNAAAVALASERDKPEQMRK